MPRSYDPQEIEKKWQNFWEKNKSFKAQDHSEKEKFYALDMFPYPSGAGLHVGHALGYTATDIISRYKRMKGFNVLHPMGWDSFGLPAEQYAMRTGTHPKVTTEKNINRYREQLKQLGFSYDWEREMATSHPGYYKWTQWFFSLMVQRGLAYEAEINVNYCPELGTVLANEEVIEGVSAIGGYPVVKKPLKQWVLKITEYADRLLKDLDLLDWPESLKQMQRNWIGRSEGALVDFVEKKSQAPISVFTTRQDTLLGVTYLVLSPEHPMISELTSEEMRSQVKAYQEACSNKSDFQRTELNKDKTGVPTGGFAIHPVTQEELPIWIADYVLMSYGTGAVMAVPSHDTRDFEFSQKYNLELRPVIEPSPETLENKSYSPEELTCWTGEGVCINSQALDFNLNGLSIKEAKQECTNWLEKNKKGKRQVNYKLRDWLFSRQRYWGEPIPILHLEDGTQRPLCLDELPLVPPEIEDYKPAGNGKSPLAKVKEWVQVKDPVSGHSGERETNTMPQWAGSCWYYLRFIDPRNEQECWEKRKEQYWLPVDSYVGGAEHAVLHLLYARFWHKVLYDCELVSTPEPFKSLRNQGMITSRSYKLPSGQYIDESEVVKEGESYRHKKTGDLLKSQYEKMSKSKLNGVNPDELIKEFGADALRLYEMFMGPFDKEKVWNTEAVTGCKRFLKRTWALVHSEKVTDEPLESALRLSNKLLEGVEQDINAWFFNTAIAKMMEFINDFSKLEAYPKESLKHLVLCLAPFAPHIAEELWETLTGEQGISYVPFPAAESKYLMKDKSECITYVVQVNGKVRGRIEMEQNLNQEAVMDKAKEDENVKRHLQEVDLVKVIFVPNKLLNIVAKPKK